MNKEQFYNPGEEFEEKGSMDDKDSQEKKISTSQQLVIYGLLIINAVLSAYVLNYTPKIGAFHLAICTAFGLVLVIFSIFAAVKCISMLIKKKGKRGINIILLILVVLLAVSGIPSIVPFVIDFFGESKTVSTDEYLVVRDHLYFRDNEGNDIYLVIPDDKAKEFRSKENYEYDHEKNLLKYYEPITITYYPNSKVIIR